MGPDLAEAMSRWQAALARLETAADRYMDGALRRSDLETELSVMQDDRTRLAGELDRASARLSRVETVTAHVGQRVSLAIGSIRDVLDREAGRDGDDLAARQA